MPSEHRGISHAFQCGYPKEYLGADGTIVGELPDRLGTNGSLARDAPFRGVRASARAAAPAGRHGREVPGGGTSPEWPDASVSAVDRCSHLEPVVTVVLVVFSSRGALSPERQCGRLTRQMPGDAGWISEREVESREHSAPL